MCSVFIENMNKADAADFQASSELSKNHQHLRNETRKRLQRLLAATPTLRDINCDVTPDEIAAEIAIVNGASIKVYITREPYQQLKVIVPKNSTVRDLKAAIRRSFTALQNRMRMTESNDPSDSKLNEWRTTGETNPNISWKYIWRTYYLQNGKDALIDDEQTLRDYDVHNKTVLKFVKKIKIDRRTQKNKMKFKKS